MVPGDGSRKEELGLIELPEGDTHVWYAHPRALTHDEELNLLYSVLSAEERSRYWRFFSPKVRGEFCAAHAMLRLALSRYLPILPSEWQFTYGENGRPYISWPAETGIYFNLTHTASLVACVISHEPLIGIDVENIEREIGHEAIAERIFSRKELEEFDATATSVKGHYFFTIWTLKEAFTKALGLGLSMPVQELSFHVEPGEVRFNHSGTIPLPPEWQFDLHDIDNHRLAVAQSGRELNVTYRELVWAQYGAFKERYLLPPAPVAKGIPEY